MQSFQLNTKDKINLWGVLNVVPLIIMICFFISNYFQQKNIYIAEINQEVRQYSQKLRENIFFIKKIEDSFSELERIGIPNICTKKVFIKLEENKKYLVQCKKNKLIKGFQINKKLHGSYASYIFSYGQDKNVESLFIDIDHQDLMDLLKRRINLEQIILTFKTSNQYTILGDKIPSILFKDEIKLTNNASIILSYNEDIIANKLRLITLHNTRSCIFLSALILICITSSTLCYGRILTKRYTRSTESINGINYGLEQNTKLLQKQHEENLKIITSLKKSYTGRMNLLIMLNERIKKNLLDSLQSNETKHSSLEETLYLLKNQEGFKIPDIEIVISSALEMIDYSIMRAKITISKKIVAKDLIELLMPRHLFYLTLSSSMFHMVQNTVYASKIEINIRSTKSSLVVLFEIEKMCEIEKTINEKIFLDLSKVQYYLKEYGGSYEVEKKNNKTEIKISFIQDLKDSKSIFWDESINKSIN